MHPFQTLVVGVSL